MSAPDPAGIVTGEERTMMVSERTTGSTTLRLLLGAGYRREPSSMPSDSQIAHALYDAQTSPDLPSRKSLDEILFLAQQSSGWTQVFKQMKSEGLIEEQTLGHVVARWTNRTVRSRRPTPSHSDRVLEHVEPVTASA
jgi:hypothetical protein